MAVAIQATPGIFTAPSAPDDLIPVSPPTNGDDIVSSEDPTATGSVWNAARVYLGRTSNAGATFALRGPGGAAPPLANAWPQGRILQAAGFTEVRLAAALTAALQAGSTAQALSLDAAASAVDDFYIGMPIQHAAIGAAASVKGTSVVMDYDGTSKLATIGETIVAPAAGSNYTIPANLTYVLGTLTTAPPLLSVSIWRDKKRYDYMDCRPTSLTIDMPVSNEQNQGYPSVEFALKGLPAGDADEASPALPSALLTTIPPYRAGKFYLDRVKLGHQSNRFTMNAEAAGASNANADFGQDAYEIMSGDRSIELDLNQMNITDFAINSRVDAQTIISMMSVWGMGVGNRFAFSTPEIVLNPLNNPGDRNGFVNLTGNAAFTGVDKSAALSLFW